MTNFERFYIAWYSRAIYFVREYVLSESDAEKILLQDASYIYTNTAHWLSG